MYQESEMIRFLYSIVFDKKRVKWYKMYHVNLDNIEYNLLSKGVSDTFYFCMKYWYY